MGLPNMPVSLYKLFAKAESARLYGGLSEIWDVGVHALAKRSNSNRFEIANEMIAMRLANFVNLPVPAGVALEESGTTYFCSMLFAGSGQKLPPADTAKLVVRLPRLASGIVIFDTWIANGDRHEGNLSFNETDEDVMIFDHGQALFGQTGSSRLADLAGSFCIDRDNHSVALDLQSFVDFDDWMDRILQLPDWHLRDIVQESRMLGVTEYEANDLFDFLRAYPKRLSVFSTVFAAVR